MGLLWWLLEDSPSGYQANGWLGQWLAGLPKVDAVAVRLVDRADAVTSTNAEGFLEVIGEGLVAEAPASNH